MIGVGHALLGVHPGVNIAVAIGIESALTMEAGYCDVSILYSSADCLE